MGKFAKLGFNKLAWTTTLLFDILLLVFLNILFPDPARMTGQQYKRVGQWVLSSMLCRGFVFFLSPLVLAILPFGRREVFERDPMLPYGGGLVV